MQEDLRNSMARTLKLAPWLCVGSLAVIAATFASNKLYIVAAFGGPILGLLSFVLFLAYWRTGKEILVHFVTGIFILASINSASAGLLWGVPQSLAFVTLFMALPMLLLGQPITRWACRSHG